MIVRLIRMAVAAAVVALAVAACALGKTSIEDRIASFIEDANAGKYSILYEHLHSDCTQRSAAKSASFWDNTPFDPDYRQFSLSGMSYGSTSTGQLISSQPVDSVTFVMKEEDADDWYILRISTGSYGLIVQ